MDDVLLTILKICGTVLLVALTVIFLKAAFYDKRLP